MYIDRSFCKGLASATDQQYNIIVTTSYTLLTPITIETRRPSQKPMQYRANPDPKKARSKAEYQANPAPKKARSKARSRANPTCGPSSPN